jgi:hypothetical protein
MLIIQHGATLLRGLRQTGVHLAMETHERLASSSVFPGGWSQAPIVKAGAELPQQISELVWRSLIEHSDAYKLSQRGRESRQG